MGSGHVKPCENFKGYRVFYTDESVSVLAPGSVPATGVQVVMAHYQDGTRKIFQGADNYGFCSNGGIHKWNDGDSVPACVTTTIAGEEINWDDYETIYMGALDVDESNGYWVNPNNYNQ